MKYSEMLDVITKENTTGSQFYIAYEMDYQLRDIHEIKIDGERFEKLCEFAYYCYLKSEGLAMVQIVKCIAYYQEEFIKGKEKDPLTMSKWDIINVAGCYEF